MRSAKKLKGQTSTAQTAEKENQKKSKYEKAINYEEDIRLYAMKSVRSAWAIAIIFGVFSVLLVIGFITVLPLKTVEPFVIRVDNVTGIPDVISAIDEETLSADEALDRYFINYYINLREGYTYQTIQKTYELTQLYSSAQVSEQFKDEYKGDKGLDTLLKKGTATVNVIAINLEELQGENLATARIEVTYTNEKNQTAKRVFSARIAYEYAPTEKFNLKNRIDNPLGFTVTAYQKIEEAI